MENWQLCPKCKGENQSNYTGIQCSVCNGTGLISAFTGLPPNRVGNSSTTNIIYDPDGIINHTK